MPSVQKKVFLKKSITLPYFTLLDEFGEKNSFVTQMDQEGTYQKTENLSVYNKRSKCFITNLYRLNRVFHTF